MEAFKNILARKQLSKTCTLSKEDTKNHIIADCTDLLKKYDFSAEETAGCAAAIEDVLSIYRDSLGEGAAVQYRGRYYRR